MMICPKCKSEKTQVISNADSKYYCVDCNHAWDARKKVEPEGSLDFSGVFSAKKIFEVLTKGQDYTPEFKAALETQLLATHFEQWFEGFKAGQMASILHAREYYGKNRDGTNTAVSSRERRNARIEEENIESAGKRENRITRAGQRRRAEDGGIKRLGSSEVRTRIGAVELISQRGLKVPESVEKMVAYLSQEEWCSFGWIKSITYDGKLMIEVNVNGDDFS